MIRPLLRIALCGLAALGFAGASISDCGAGSSVFQFTELAMTPDPPVRGQPLYMTVKFNNPGPDVTDGTVTNTITLNYIPYPPSTEALCTNTQCPLTTGANDRSTSSVWPDTVSGRLTSKIEWTDAAGAQLLCIKIQSTIAAAGGSRLRGSASVNATEAELIADAFRWHSPVALEAPPMCMVEEMAIGPWLNQTHGAYFIAAPF